MVGMTFLLSVLTISFISTLKLEKNNLTVKTANKYLKSWTFQQVGHRGKPFNILFYALKASQILISMDLINTNTN